MPPLLMPPGGIEEGTTPPLHRLAERAGLVPEPLLKLFQFLLLDLMFPNWVLITRSIKVDDVA